MSSARAIVLFGHGSRDPLWHRPMQAVEQRILERDPTALVRCAYLEITAPDLPSAAAELVAAGVRHVSVVPFFLGVGRHAREDLPGLIEQLRGQHPEVLFTLQAAIGEDERLINLVAQIATTSTM